MNEQEAKAIVLEYLKKLSSKSTRGGMCIVDSFWDEFGESTMPVYVEDAFIKLSPKTEFEILAEFAAWGLKEGAKG